MKKYSGKYDLQDRLVKYAVRIIKLSESLPKTGSGNHIAGQILSLQLQITGKLKGLSQKLILSIKWGLL